MGSNSHDASRSSVVTEPTRRSGAPSLWNPNAAGLWSILLTPTFGSYLLRKNWVEIGDAEKARSAKMWLIASAAMIPPTTMTALLGLVYLIAWHLVFQKKQARYVQSHWGGITYAKGGQSRCLLGFRYSSR